MPRAHVTVNFVVSINGKGTFYFSIAENRFVLSFASIGAFPTCAGTPLAHTEVLSSSPLRDTHGFSILPGCHCEPVKQKHHPLLLRLPSFIFNIISYLHSISHQALCWVQKPQRHPHRDAFSELGEAQIGGLLAGAGGRGLSQH